MDLWERRIIGFLTLGGAATGFFLTVAQLVTTSPTLLNATILTIFLLLFVIGIVAGTLVLEQDLRAFWFGIAFWLLQIPVLETGLINYHVYSGATLSLKFGGDGWFDTHWAIGTSFIFQLQDYAPPAVVGVNLLAGFVAWRFLRQRSGTASVEDDPQPPTE